MTPALRARDLEWIEPDGLGGFASGTVSGERTRRYHALLLVASTPPTGRYVLVNGLEVWVERGGRREALSVQRYVPDVPYPDGDARLAGFEREPWPCWTWRLADGAVVGHQLFAPQGRPLVALSWNVSDAAGPTWLRVRPLLSGRDSHALHHENPAFRFDARAEGERVTWRPYDGVPEVCALTNGVYHHAPDWYRQFLYTEERARGLDDVEDLASPGELSFDLTHGEAVLLLSAPSLEPAAVPQRDAASELRHLRAIERRRRASLGGPLDRAADQYLVRRGDGLSIVAGYPWFCDWSRDTFIAMRGLCLARGRLREAGRILETWASSLSQGMLPNRFPDFGHDLDTNSVDGSLWFVIAAHEYLTACAAHGVRLAAAARARLDGAIGEIVSAYAAGTRHGIRADGDGLLACGVPGLQLTWMDARVAGHEVTPRIGKPVEVQALWINALRIAAARAAHWSALAHRAHAAFLNRFWCEERGHLHDVVDVDHEPGACDPTLRPNQLLALGGLPFRLLEGARAHRVLERIEAELVTPLGLRTLTPSDPRYHAHYAGGVDERDGAYHQGTAWPWLTGALVDAWVHARGATPEVQAEAWHRFGAALHHHLEQAGLGHVSEIADAERPHVPRGCPFQAWSLGELLRIERVLLAHRSGDHSPLEPATPPEPANVHGRVSLE